MRGAQNKKCGETPTEKDIYLVKKVNMKVLYGHASYYTNNILPQPRKLVIISIIQTNLLPVSGQNYLNTNQKSGQGNIFRGIQIVTDWLIDWARTVLGKYT